MIFQHFLETLDEKHENFSSRDGHRTVSKRAINVSSTPIKVFDKIMCGRQRGDVMSVELNLTVIRTAARGAATARRGQPRDRWVPDDIRRVAEGIRLIET